MAPNSINRVTVGISAVYILLTIVLICGGWWYRMWSFVFPIDQRAHPCPLLPTRGCANDEDGSNLMFEDRDDGNESVVTTQPPYSNTTD